MKIPNEVEEHSCIFTELSLIKFLYCRLC